MKLFFLSLAAVVLATSTTAQAATNNLRGVSSPEQAQQKLERSLYNKVAPPVDNTRGIFFPGFRYVPWDDLDSETQEQAVILEYTPETWNQPGTNEIEQVDFMTIIDTSKRREDEMGATVLVMGWTPDMYDCYVNHYEAYSWEELETETDTVPYWNGLGWNSSSWDGTIDYPDTEGMDWDELSEEEQQAAIALCFFEELWMETDLTEWGVEEEYSTNSTNTTNATAAPSMEQTEEDTEMEGGAIDSDGDMEVTEAPVEDTEAPVEEVEVPATEPPVDTPTVVEEEEETTEAPMEETEPPVDTTTTTTTTTEAVYVPNPNNRFLLWEWLYDVSKAAALTLGYDETTWNQPMTSAVEALTFEDLSTDEMEAAFVLGFAPAEVWNCHINHYAGFAWNDLDTVVGGAQEHYMTLGWNEDSWNALSTAPLSENLDFEELSDEEQAAAEQLCFRAETWDQLNLNEWVA